MESKILIVDDNLQNIKVLGSTLKKNGYLVSAVKSGEAALKYLKNNKPDVILLDIMMDKMDGFEVCRKIKENPEIQDIPVIFLTAKAAEEDVVKGFAGGAVDYITKPFITAEVLVRIENHLNKKKYLDLIHHQKQKLENANKELIELTNFKELMTYSIVHDLKNPLAHIASKIENNEAKHAVFKMQNLVANILNVQKFDEAKMFLSMEEFCWNEMMKNVLDQTNYLIEQKNLKISITSPDRLLLIADKELITRVMINLLINAVKYTPNNGKITIAATHNNTNVIIDVVDTGIGISPDFLPKIFDRFVHINKQTESNQYSTGLGLSFCKMAIEAHGGQIIVKSKQNSGTTFSLSIPANYAIQRSSSTFIVSSEKQFLTQNDAEILKDKLKKLEILKVYQITQILEVINEIKNSHTNPSILNWCNSLNEAANSCNEQLYIDLIKLTAE